MDSLLAAVVGLAAVGGLGRSSGLAPCVGVAWSSGRPETSKFQSSKNEFLSTYRRVRCPPKVPPPYCQADDWIGGR